MFEWIGYRWLAERYEVQPVQPFRADSQIARSRTTERDNGYVHEFYLPSQRPAATLGGHLSFALKHEGIHLEFLARLFQVLPVTELKQWIESEPTGQYSRRAGFFYEWLTGKRIDFSGVTAGNYVNALDEQRYLTATRSENNLRWRVRNNLPGTTEYCPIVMRTDSVQAAELYNCSERLNELEAEYGVEILRRSAVWLTVKESRASFAIEHEEKSEDKITRFAVVMEQRCGFYKTSLDNAALLELQAEILGKIAIRYGLRKSPVFVGSMDSFANVVHYIGPHWDNTQSMLNGLKEFENRTIGKSAILRAAVISFAFVYIHPMIDGNGRISRFLVNDVLRRDGAVPAPFILPISATIQNAMHRYDDILELVSKPFMQRYLSNYEFGPEKIADDGIRYNLNFNAYDDALSTWRYPDLTSHVEYMAEVIDVTINREMRKQAAYLRSLSEARIKVKNLMDGPNSDIDRIIRSVRENGGVLSNKLKKEFPVLANAIFAHRVVDSINASFSPGTNVDNPSVRNNELTPSARQQTGFVFTHNKQKLDKPND